jgi:hypothetical protein
MVCGGGGGEGGIEEGLLGIIGDFEFNKKAK